MMRRWMVVLGVALTLGLAGCAEPMDDAQWVEAPDGADEAGADGGKADRAEVPFYVFADDVGDRGADEVRVVLRTRAAYRAYFDHAPPPEVDFATHWVFFYSAGTQAGATASVDSITRSRSGKTLYVATRLVAPPAACAAAPAPATVLVAFPRPTPRPTIYRSTHVDELGACPTCADRPVADCEADPACEIGLDGCDPPPIDPDTGLPHPCDPILVCQPRAAPHHARKVALIVYDPVDPASGERLSTANGWWGAAALEAHSDELAAAIRTATDGHVAFEVVERHVVDEFPVKRDGFRYTWASYQACRANPETCHRPDDVAYLPMLREDTGADLCQAIASGAIDEVWVWGFDYSGFDELAFKVPGDATLYPTTPYNYWIYDGRTKDLPACGRTYFVMGWNALVPGGNALHSFGHRIESALTIAPPGRGRWGACDGTSEWTDFACVAKDGGGVGGCGNIHFPPNGQSDYDYANAATVPSYCDDYAQYPALTRTTSPVTASTWSPTGGDTQWDYLMWWMAHLPRGAGSHVAGGVEVANDWWRYILCYDGACPLTR